MNDNTLNMGKKNNNGNGNSNESSREEKNPKKEGPSVNQKEAVEKAEPEKKTVDSESEKVKLKDLEGGIEILKKDNDKLNEEIDKIKKENDKLNEDNDKLKKDVAKEKDDYLRLMADLDNLRRHSAREKLDLIASASADTIKGLLPVLDDCERALAMLEKSGDEVAKEGTALIYNKLMAFLKTKGVETVKAKGEKFNTDFHEAVAQVPVEEKDKKGLVFDVVQTGYTLSGKVIRYAKVIVGI